MSKSNKWWLAILTVFLAGAVISSASAQNQWKKKGGSASAPAHAARPAGRAVPHIAPRQSFTPHAAPRRVFTPHAVQRRAFTPHVTPRRSFAVPHRVVRPYYAPRRTLRRTVTPHLRTPRITRETVRSRTTTQPTLRTLQRRQVQPSTVGQAIRSTQPRLRRTGAAAISPQVARHGRFAAPYQVLAQGRVPHLRGAHLAAHRAWRHGRRAAFVAWYGPVFWPYAYSDIFDYAFWPYGYDDGFWAYIYDDFFDGMFWGEIGPPVEYAYAAPAGPRASYAGVEELCTQPGTGITSWPFARIEREVGLNAEQKQLLDDVRAAAKKAAAVFKTSCLPQRAFPLTPSGRLQGMRSRLQATLEAVQTVRPALDRFYNSLSDEQKARFNALGPKPASKTEVSEALDASTCKQPKAGLVTLPIESIDEVVKPTDLQAADLKRLQEATDKAVTILQAACPEDTPLTPTGRLEAMEKRLQAMVEAADTVKPALDSFYASLSNEQKARFNVLGRELVKPQS